MSANDQIEATVPAPAGPFADDTLDDDDEWDVAPPPRRRLHWTTMLLALAVACVLAFGGGILAQKHWGRASSASGFAFPRGGSLPAGLAQALGAGAAGGGTGGLSGPGGDTTAGTVSYIQGATLYVTTATGTVARVVVPKGLLVDRTVKSKPSTLRPGETVDIQGTTASNGTVRATNVTVTAR